MNIKTQTLRQFQKIAYNFSGRNILPITAYLKFEKGKITKTILTSFVQMDCEGIDEDLLVDEKDLYTMINSTSSEFINITKKGKKVLLDDTKMKMSFQVEPVEVFPSIPQSDGEGFGVSLELLDSIYVASQFSAQSESIPTARSFVMIGKSTVCGSDGFIAFKSNVEETFTAIIDKSVAKFISKLPITKFGTSDTYYFFFTDKITMGFSKSEIGYADMTVFFPKELGRLNFTIDPSDLMTFGASAIKLVELPYCILSNGIVRLKENDSDKSLDIKIDSIIFDKEFSFFPDQMNRMLSAIQSSELDFYYSDNKFYIKSGNDNFTTLIMGLKIK